MNTDEKPLSPLYYDDYLEKKILSLHMDNVVLEKEIKTLRETNRASKDLPMIHLLRANGDLLPEVAGDTITFELEYKGDNCLGRPPTTMGTDPHDSIVYNALGKSRLTASLKFARRTDITEGQAQPVLDEFIAEVRAWFAETFKLEPARTGVS